MKAVVYHGPRNMKVDNVPDPTIQAPNEAILRVTATAICGSDMHMYNGFMAPFMKQGDIMGHEFMGVVEEVGPEVKKIKKGDRVIVPFVIACGTCFFCKKTLFSACETTNPSTGAALTKGSLRPPAALYGFSHLYGGISGGQAELVRILEADANLFKVDPALSDEQVLFLTDILPTGYQAVLNAEVGPGSSVAVIGAGPVGFMAVLCAKMLGATKIYVIDDEQYRLDFIADQLGAMPINFAKEDPAERIIKDTNLRGVDATIDAVGFEAKGNTIETVLRGLQIQTGSGTVLREGIAAVRRGGTLSIPGVYTGFLHGFLIGDAFDKGITFKMGQTNVHRFVEKLLAQIKAGKIQPEAVISHRLPLDEAPTGYDVFANHKDNCRKVVLFPGGVKA